MIEQPENLNLGDLLSGRVPFRVPRYQRAYSWDNEEVNDFIGDLHKLYESRVANESKIHFFGGVVSFEERAPNTSTRRVYIVVDGQQRLATFFILLSLLMKEFILIEQQASNENDLATQQAADAYAKRIQEEFLEYKEVVNNRRVSHYRLRLSNVDADFFSELLSGNVLAAQRVSHNRLISAHQRLTAFIIDKIYISQSLTAAQKLERLLHLQTCLTEDCYLILIVSDNREEAYRLFAILNDRGKILSDGDKLRSYTLEFLEEHSNQQNRVAQIWDDILAYPDSEVDDFFRAYYPSHEGQRAPRRDLADSFLQSFFNYPVSPLPQLQVVEANAIETRISGLRSEQLAFMDIINGSWPYSSSQVTLWEQMRVSHLIKVLRHTLCIPLLLSAVQNMAQDRFAELICLLERFVFRYINIGDVNATRLGEVYYDHSSRIRRSPGTYNLDDLRQDLRRLQDTGAPDASFLFRLEEQLQYNNRNFSAANMLIRYFFATLEDYMRWYERGASGNPTSEMIMTFDLRQINIEHIYPRNPMVRDVNLDPLINNIGNLGIWSPIDNNTAGNQPFLNKRNLYAASNIRLNQKLATFPTWDLATLRNRKNEIFDMARRIFTA